MPFQFYLNDAFCLEEPVNAPVFTHVPAITIKGVTDFSNGAVSILCQGLHQQSSASWPVALIGNLLKSIASAPPNARLIVRSILSIGMLASRALCIAIRSRKFALGSPLPPSRTATTISRPNRVKSWPLLASLTPLERRICAHLE